SICLTLLAFEVLFALVFIDTDAFAQTLASNRWLHLYFWNHVNALGYRDVEHPPELFRSRRSVLVLGDSFVAGYGIKDPRDRFSDILQQRLGDDWVVANVSG